MENIRWFEVEMQNGTVAVLTEKEIENYRPFVKDVRTQLTDQELREIAPGKLDKKTLGILTK